jgi:peptide/nickel transport system permease protein
MIRGAARLLSLLAMSLLIFGLTRALIHALPGDPLETLLAETGTAVPREILRAELRLDRPFLAGIAEDLRAVATRGDLGRSILTRQPVAPLLAARLARTVALATAAVVWGLTLSLALGLAAAEPGASRLARALDRLCTGFGALSAALPTPWIGPMLIYALAVRLPLFPLGGHLALPALTLALAFAGLWSRLVRERVRETLRLGAAQAARARGIPEWRVLVKYGLAPASGALLAYLGTQFGALLGGAMVTEVVFDWPGVGSLLVESVLKRDYPVVEAAVFATALLSLLGTALGDWAQAWIDPRRQPGAA